MTELRSQFTASVKVGKAPLLVNFTNTSTGAYTSVRWDFGDGSFSTEIHPSHQFVNDGTYSVTLQIYTIEGENQTVSTSSQSISIFPDNEIDSEISTEQSTLNVTKRFEAGQVNVVQSIQTSSTYEINSLIQSGDSAVFLNDDIDILEYEDSLQRNGTFILDLDFYNTYPNMIQTGGGGLNSTGGTNSDLTSNGHEQFQRWFNYVMNGEDIGPDYSKCIIGIPMLNSTTGLSLTGGTESDFEMSNFFDSDTGIPGMQWFNITSITATPRDGAFFYSFIIDGFIPSFDNMDPDGTLPLYVIVNSDATEIYPYGPYFGNAHGDPDTPYLKIKFGLDHLNTQFFDNGEYNANATANGFLKKIGAESTNKLGQVKTIIFPDYQTITDANALAPGTNYLFIPWVNLNKSSIPQLKLYDIAGEVEIDPISTERFKWMRLGTNEESEIIGRIYYDLKAIVIDDPEVNIALQINSNRSFTCGTPRAIQTTEAGWATTGVTYFITYQNKLDETLNIASNISVGHYPHGEIVTVTPNVDQQKIYLYANPNNWEVPDASTNYGYTLKSGTDNITVYIATGSTSTELNPSSWREHTYSNFDLITGEELSQSYDTMTPTSWDVSGSSLEHLGVNSYTPGDETIMCGYMSGNLETISYKITATCVAKNSEFNQTQNTSYVSGSTYISEVGIHNENNDLLMVGKLNKPIEKNEEKYVVIKMELDL